MRVFTCHKCGHKMRLQGRRCGKCLTMKPVEHQATTWAWGAAGIGLLLVVLYMLS